MIRRFAFAVLASGLASCTAPTGFYETEDADAAPIYRSLIGRFPKAPECIRTAFDGDKTDEAALKAALDSYSPLLTDLARATRARRLDWSYNRPPCLTEDFPLDYGVPVARILTVRSRLRFEHGDVDGALEDLL